MTTTATGIGPVISSIRQVRLRQLWCAVVPSALSGGSYLWIPFSQTASTRLLTWRKSSRGIINIKGATASAGAIEGWRRSNFGAVVSGRVRRCEDRVACRICIALHRTALRWTLRQCGADLCIQSSIQPLPPTASDGVLPRYCADLGGAHSRQPPYAHSSLTVSPPRVTFPTSTLAVCACRPIPDFFRTSVCLPPNPDHREKTVL